MERSVLQRARALPDRIGSYVVEKQLSASGGLQVYLAREEGPVGFSRDVVLKVASNVADDDVRSVKELGREATACAKLNHPGIVRTYQFFEHGHALVLVLEYVDGISLGELIAKGVKGERLLGDDAALHVGLSILEALAHAHAQVDERGAAAPVVHRAVSPANILIGRDGNVKLGGFGFAKVSGLGADTTGSLTWEPGYMAPEQITEQQLSPKVDVYAAGLILWELLTGRPATILPRDPLDIEATLRAVTERKFEPLATLRRDLPRELVAVVDAALVASHAKRTIGCAEMAQWIGKVAYVGEAKRDLGERVRAALAGAPARALSPPAPAAVAAVPAPAPVAVAAVPAPAPMRAALKNRTLLGVAPPAIKDARPRSAAVPAPPATPSRAAPPPPPAPAIPPRVPPSPVAPPVVAPLVAPPVVPPLVAPPFDAPPAFVAPPVGAAPAAPVSAFAATMMAAPAMSPFSGPLPGVPIAPKVPPSSGIAAALSIDAAHASAAPFAPADASEDLELPVNRPFANVRRWLSRAGSITLSRVPVGRLSALVQKVPMPPWSRQTWMTAWVGLGAGLVGLVGALTIGTARTPAAMAHASPEPQGSAVIVAPPLSAPPAPAPSPSIPPAPAASPPAAPIAAGAALGAPAASPDALLDRNYGHLTVHSVASYANVYVMFAKFGQVNEELAIPCGRRFVAIGVPVRGRREPIWLAPGRFMQIPCGGSHEITMNPRALRPRASQ